MARLRKGYCPDRDQVPCHRGRNHLGCKRKGAGDGLGSKASLRYEWTEIIGGQMGTEDD